jgi:hypothetical protein
VTHAGCLFKLKFVHSNTCDKHDAYDLAPRQGHPACGQVVAELHLTGGCQSVCVALVPQLTRGGTWLLILAVVTCAFLKNGHTGHNNRHAPFLKTQHSTCPTCSFCSVAAHQCNG